nr:MAG TPA: hypothetical protein [Caudoviricetes sp.]
MKKVSNYQKSETMGSGLPETMVGMAAYMVSKNFSLVEKKFQKLLHWQDI